MRIGVLAVQGAYAEHEQMLAQIGVDSFEIRQKKDLKQEMDGLILPGGESTVMGKLLREQDILEDLREKIVGGLPVLGTCAGLILLAQEVKEKREKGNSEKPRIDQESVTGYSGKMNKQYLATLPVTVCRNAYGRQLGSFRAEGEIKGIGTFPMTFIRAPYVSACQEGVEVLAEVDGRIVGVRYQNQIGLAFHPEVTGDIRIHTWFADICR